jgi:tetratricopeptide (TPR) repeat protein
VPGVPQHHEMHDGLVGRDRELAVFEEHLGAAREGAGRLVLVGGEAGIGKTRFADACSERARATGFRVLWGRCWEAGGAPAYWPWIQVLRIIARDDARPTRATIERHADRLAAIIPELQIEPTAPLPDTDPESVRFQLFDAITSTLRSAASHQHPTLIVLDDVHAADESSLLLLRFAARELGDAPIAFLVLHRDPELAATDPRQILLAEIARDPFCVRIRPTALDGSEVARMIEASIGTRPTAAVARAIAQASDGNPLFATEIARLLADEGALTAAELPVDRLAVPEGVKAVISRRLARLSSDCRSMLQLASIIGREFDLELLGELGSTPAAALAAIDEAMEARVVLEVRTGIGRWRFGHALMRDVLYESLPLPVRTGLHDRVGRALERLSGDDPDEQLSEIANHFVLAAPGGDVERAVRYSRMAGHRATLSAAHEEAVKHHRTALAALDLDRSADERERCRILIDLGEAQSRAGSADARTTLRDAASLAERLGLPDELARAAIAYGGRFMWSRAGADPYLVPLLERALEMRVDRDDAVRVRLLSRLAGALRDEPDLARRSAVAADAVALARRLEDPSALVHALSARLWAIWGPDSLGEIPSLADELDALVVQTGDIERMADARCVRICALSMVGIPPDELERIMATFVHAVDQLGQPAQRWYLNLIRTVMALARGEYAAAEELIVTTREWGRRTQDWDATVAERLARFTLAKELDELETVLPAIEAAIVDAPTYRLFPAARAYIEAELGRLDDARTHLDAILADGLGSIARDNSWLWTLVHLAETALALDDVPTMEGILELLEPYSGLASSAAGETIAGPVGRTVGDLASRLGRFDVAEAAFAEAYALVTRTGWRPWEGWTRLSRARMLRRRGGPGDEEEAARELARAAAIADEIGMPALTARVRAMDRGSVPASAVGMPPDRSEDARSFVREGEVWVIRSDGRTMRLADTKGLRYLATLLAAPGREIPAIDLVSAAPLDAGPGPDDPLLDAEARASYRARLEELQSEIEEADRFGDPERAARHREEFEAIVEQLTAATGLGRRPRGMTTAAERARQSVTKAIKGALDRIDGADPLLGAELRYAVRTGMLCSYLPDPRDPARWHVEGIS